MGGSIVEPVPKDLLLLAFVGIAHVEPGGVQGILQWGGGVGVLLCVILVKPPGSPKVGSWTYSWLLDVDAGVVEDEDTLSSTKGSLPTIKHTHKQTHKAT